MQDNGLVQVSYIVFGAGLALIGSILTQAYQNFRNKSAYSGAKSHPIPVESTHRFRLKVPPDSV